MLELDLANSRVCSWLTTSRHSREVSSTFALSTLVTFGCDERRLAASKAVRAIRSISSLL